MPLRNSVAESVLVIVDRDFGEKLRTIPAGRPVWIAMSSANAPIVRSLWESRGPASHLAGVTGFRFNGAVSAEHRFFATLDTIDLHHGPHSSTSPYDVVIKMRCDRGSDANQRAT